MSRKKKKIIIIIILITFFSVKVFNLLLTNFNVNVEQNKKELTTEIKEEKVPINKVFIDIEGAVSKPGMYEINEDIRLGEVIELAGGLTHANKECINLAAKISDEQYINIPKEGEMCQNEKSLSQNNEKESDLVNINTADEQELQSLKGIGQTRATDIINYRESNGEFQQKEDLKNVSGIGDATYEKIKDQITI